MQHLDLVLIAAAATLACGAPADRCAASASSAALTFGQLADSSTSTVFLELEREKCTGIVVDRRSILTAAHCVSPAAATVAASIATGVRAERCVGAAADPCAAVSLRVIRHPPSDVALLQADAELAGIDFERLPVLLAAGHVDRFLGYGYGEGAYYDPSSDTELRPAEVGTTLLVGEFEDVGSPASYIRALASRSGSVCDGDSGGPAVLTIDGRAAVAGVLFSSEGSGACTPEGGAQLWTRLSTIPNGIQGALEDCVTTTSDGYTLVGCGRTEPRAGTCR